MLELDNTPIKTENNIFLGIVTFRKNYKSNIGIIIILLYFKNHKKIIKIYVIINFNIISLIFISKKFIINYSFF